MSRSTERFTSAERVAITKTKRATLQATVSRRLARSIFVNDFTLADIGRAVGVAASKVSRWIDPEAAETPKLADLEMMPREVALAMIRDAASAHGLGVYAKPDNAGGDDEEHLAVVISFVRESGEAASGTLEAAADGKITADEARKMLPEVVEANAVGQRLQHLLEGILRAERVA